MDKLARLLLRLRRRALRCYELGLYALLIALALAVALPAASAGAEDDAARCRAGSQATLPAWGMPHPPSR